MTYIRQFVDRFAIGPSEAQIGLVTFNGFARNRFWLDTYHNASILKFALEHIARAGGRTNIGEGLKFVRENSFLQENGARADSRRLAILITDAADGGTNTAEEARKLREMSPPVTLFGVGLGGDETSFRTARYGV